MFCFVCQKHFRTKSAYKLHVSSTAHSKAEENYGQNRPTMVRRNTANFIADFHSFVSQTASYVELGQLYSRYLAKNRFRIEGTGLKSIEDAVEMLAGRISVIRENGKTMVKCLDRFELVKNPVTFSLDRLRHPFSIRMVRVERPGCGGLGNIFEDAGQT